MNNGTTRQDTVEKINNMIKDIKIAMLTTMDEQGHMHSRPMMTQEVEFDGTIWFFTELISGKTNEVEHNPYVNVTYSNDKTFVSIAGRAQIVQDLQRKKELWHEPLKIWFKGGPESPHVALLRIDGISAQYWDSPSGGIVGSAVAIAKVLLGGDPEDAGENEKVRLL